MTIYQVFLSLIIKATKIKEFFMRTLNIRVPAKALLFGEYGVLSNGKAVAVTFDQYYFTLSFLLKPSLPSDSSIKIVSDYFPNKVVTFSTQELLQTTITDNNQLFFISLLKPWSNFLQENTLTIEILESYSPDLGFGSSSALIAGISAAFNSFFLADSEIFSNTYLWNNIRNSIKNIQIKGSGYDVAVQLAACTQQNLKHNKINFWEFENLRDTPIPKVTIFNPDADIENYGCFVKTNIYSDTKKALKTFIQDAEKEFFANEHTKLCNSFLKNSDINNSKSLMKKSLEIAKRQKIIPSNEPRFFTLMTNLEKENIFYKTMGAGHGDCLWILASAKTLIDVCNISQNDIVFAFTKLEP